MSNLQTGVDRLMALVRQSHKISLEDAAKDLGVNKLIVQEWGEFLQEEGLLTIKYTLSNTFLVEHEQTPEEVQHASETLARERETFIHQSNLVSNEVKASIAELDEFKKEIGLVLERLNSGIDDLQSQLTAIDEIKSVKETVKQLAQEHAASKKAADEIIAESHKYKSQHQEIALSIKNQEKKVSDQRKRVKQLGADITAAHAQLESYAQQIGIVHKKVVYNTEQVAKTEHTLLEIRELLLDGKTAPAVTLREELPPLPILPPIPRKASVITEESATHDVPVPAQFARKEPVPVFLDAPLPLHGHSSVLLPGHNLDQVHEDLAVAKKKLQGLHTHYERLLAIEDEKSKGLHKIAVSFGVLERQLLSMHAKMFKVPLVH
jgi:hypothetical protein